MTENLNKVGLEEFLEDDFGLNIRSAKTLWITFKKPADYFKAATTPLPPKYPLYHNMISAEV